MILYHGTSTKVMDKILEEGIQPRDVTGISTWEGDIASRPGLVYLTSCYPVFYGQSAVGKLGGKIVIFMVDIQTGVLYPDEDFVGTALALKAKRSDIKFTTKLIAGVDPRDYQHAWESSLNYMGTVCSEPVHKNNIVMVKTVPNDINLQIALGLDTNPQALARSGIPISSVGEFCNYRKRLETFFQFGEQAVMDGVKQQYELLLKEIKK